MPYDAYEPVIGLEVHVQLDTESKIFSPDSTAFGADPNAQVDPVSLGHPGTLPVLNGRAVHHALRLGVATHAKISRRSVFARKHYFYPDLPKGYQISQYDTPICYDGYVEIEREDAPSSPDEEAGDDADPTRGASLKRVGLTRIHLEEDAGKSIHPEADAASLIDYNRCGVPLVEIVTEPDLRSPHEAYQFLEKLRQIVRYLQVSDGNMEEGSLRCDANVSVRPRGHSDFGTRTELKNLNSMRHVEDALAYEITRQIAARERGASVSQQTLLWDPDTGVTRPMRTKEEAHDYRYFPDPDLVPITVDEDRLDAVRASLPEMPDARRRRFIEDVGLPPYDAGVLTEEREVADYFEETLQQVFKRTKGGDTQAQAKAVSNHIMTDVLRVLNEDDRSVDDLPVTPERLAQLVYLRLQDRVSSSAGQEVFERMMEEPEKSAGKIADEYDLIQVSDRDAIESVVASVVDENEEKVRTYLDGKEGLLGFFIGQVMQRFDGSPNPKLVRELLNEHLERRRAEA